MASCHLVWWDNTSRSEAGVPHGSHQRLLRRHVMSKAVPSRRISLHSSYAHSHLPFNLARALKNNHPGHAPLLPIISLIYPHLSLWFSCPSLYPSPRLPCVNCLCRSLSLSSSVSSSSSWLFRAYLLFLYHLIAC